MSSRGGTSTVVVARMERSEIRGKIPAFRCARSGYDNLNPALQRAHEDGACGAAIELHRIAAGGRILRRHLHDGVDLVVADLEPGKGMRNARLLAQFQHEIHEGAEARLQADVSGQPLDLV